MNTQHDDPEHVTVDFVSEETGELLGSRQLTMQETQMMSYLQQVREALQTASHNGLTPNGPARELTAEETKAGQEAISVALMGIMNAVELAHPEAGSDAFMAYMDAAAAPHHGDTITSDPAPQLAAPPVSLTSTSVLRETEDGDAWCDMVEQSVREGTSSLCQACGSIVKPDRMAAHRSMWCDVLDGDEDDERR
jgi:hypothetical protein